MDLKNWPNETKGWCSVINGQEFECISCELSVEKASYLDPGSVKRAF